MDEELTVMFATPVWAAIVEYEPFSPELALDAGVRRRLRTAAAIPGGMKSGDAHVVSLTRPQAQALETWLVFVESRRDAPAAVSEAIDQLREAKRRPR